MTIEEVLGADAVYFSLTPRAWEPLHAAVQAGGAPRAPHHWRNAGCAFPGLWHPPPAPVSSTQACVVPGGLPRGRAIARGQPQHQPRAQDHPDHQGRE